MISRVTISGALLLLVTLIPCSEARSGGTSLSTLRLNFYQAVRGGKLASPCAASLPSSQNSVIVVFPKHIAQSMMIFSGGRTILAMMTVHGPKIVGTAEALNVERGFSPLSTLLAGRYRTTCGTFRVSPTIWKTPMTYYAIDPHQGEVVSGTLSRQGTFTRVKASYYEYDGPPLQLESLPGE